MPEPLTVALYTPQPLALPSQRIRIVEPLALLRQPVRLLLCSGYTRDNQYVVDGKRWAQADVVIAQRNFPTADTIALLRAIKAAGKKLIYETDDAFQLLPDDHPKAFHRVNAPYIDEAARLADTVVVSTEALKVACYADHPQVVVAENMLSPRIWTEAIVAPPREATDTRVTIALVGGGHHRHDFFMLKPLLEQLDAELGNIRWVAYGDATGDLVQQMGAAHVRIIPKNYDYATHPARLALMQADLALCPLLDTPFNRCISDIKFIEFGWLKVPLVASNLAGYAQHIRHGENGLLCATTDDWKQGISMLVRDAALRARLGASARAYTSSERVITMDNNSWNSILNT